MAKAPGANKETSCARHWMMRSIGGSLVWNRLAAERGEVVCPVDRFAASLPIGLWLNCSTILLEGYQSVAASLALLQ